MRRFFKLLHYIRPYLGLAFLNVLFNLLSIVAGLFSFTLIIPFLRLLFSQEAAVTEAPPLTLSFDAVYGNFNFYLSQLIATEGPEYALMFICGLVVSMVLLKNLFRYLALYFMVPLRSYAIRDIRKNLFEKILRLPLSYFSDERRGDLITRMSSDVQEIEASIMSSLEAIFKEPLTIIVYLGSLIWMSPQLTLFVLLTLPITALVIGRIGKSLRKDAHRTQDRLGQMISLFEETLSGMRIIKGFNAEPYFRRSFLNENTLFTKLNIVVNRKRDASSPLSETMSVAVLVGILWFGGKMVLSGTSTLQAEVFIGYIGIFSQIVSPSKAFSTAFYNVQKGSASIDRINKIMDSEEKIVDKPNAQSFDGFKDSITFKDVSFSYGQGPVLQDINLTIKKGTTVALVGPSGGGKSTLADLIPRFYDPISGELSIDGQPLQHYKITDLRDAMGIVTQESILFNDSVYNNIAFGNNEATQEQVEAAAKVANAHDFIVDMERGYQTSIGEKGGKLSGGQRQRISIARAVLKNPDILILDEATSALDTTSEKVVQEALSKVMQNRTAVVIAHRLSTIRSADMIVVIEQGQIVQTGSHEELITKEGLYQELHSLQQWKD